MLSISGLPSCSHVKAMRTLFTCVGVSMPYLTVGPIYMCWGRCILFTRVGVCPIHMCWVCVQLVFGYVRVQLITCVRDTLFTHVVYPIHALGVCVCIACVGYVYSLSHVLGMYTACIGYVYGLSHVLGMCTAYHMLG